jgi:hypothetical protein
MNLDVDVDYEQDSSSEDEEQDAADSDDFLAIGRYVITEVEEFLAQAAGDELGNNRRKRTSAGGTRAPYKRRSFDNHGAYQCILRDHLGPEPTVLCAKELQWMDGETVRPSISYRFDVVGRRSRQPSLLRGRFLRSIR